MFAFHYGRSIFNIDRVVDITLQFVCLFMIWFVSLHSIPAANTMTKSRLVRKGAFYGTLMHYSLLLRGEGGNSRQNLEVGTDAETEKNASDRLAPRGLLNLLSCTPQDHSSGVTHQQWAEPSIKPSIKKMPQQLAHRTI